MQPALQDIVNRINQVNNILVTVKANPTVDELSAALGLTMALNNYGKHATAVFSGQIPNAMSFLKPQKTFENNVHSLRDFIISLNKEKADKLRFAKDGEIVKIYITPYKSTITPTDLEYSEGDFNVEMVLAIGINVKEELDAVIAAHGRILHEATVATVMPGTSPSQLGSINWSDPTLTSSSAMTLQLLQSLNVPNLLSPEVSTALLTGIVADTDRFSNANTSPRVMELSAQLMNSGANHTLVTSSIGTGAHPTAAAGTIAPQTVTPEANQDLVLDLHTPAPAPVPTAPQINAPATNTAPMVTSPVEPEASATLPPPPPPPPSPVVEEVVAQPSPAVAELLPAPVDTSQTIVPADLMPPQDTSLSPAPELPTVPTFSNTGSQTPLDTAPFSGSTTAEAQALASPPEAVEPVPTPTEAPQLEASAKNKPAEDDIRSEIDKIYSAEPFDPANNPRQDLGTNIALPTEEHVQELGAPAVSVDTSVQEAQATSPALKPIAATKDEAIDPNSVLGSSPSEAPDASVAQVPGLEMPPEIAPPPPPPNPLASQQKTSSIDTEPFGNSVDFDPTK